MISEAKANKANSEGGGPSRPELVRRLATQDDEDGRGKQVGIDGPFHRCGTELEAGRHCGQGRHDCRAVFADGQHRQATGDEHQTGIARH